MPQSGLSVFLVKRPIQPVSLEDLVVVVLLVENKIFYRSTSVM
jgi:hypothetical protein